MTWRRWAATRSGCPGRMGTIPASIPSITCAGSVLATRAGRCADNPSPRDTLQVSNVIEMPVAAQERQIVLAAQGRNPDIVGRDRSAGAPQFKPNRRVFLRGVYRNFECLDR